MSQHYEVPCERQYEYVDKTAIVPPKTFTYDYAVFDGPLKSDHGTRVGLNRTGEDDYVIKNDTGDTSYISVTDASSLTGGFHNFKDEMFDINNVLHQRFTTFYNF